MNFCKDCKFYFFRYIPECIMVERCNSNPISNLVTGYQHRENPHTKRERLGEICPEFEKKEDPVVEPVVEQKKHVRGWRFWK